MIKELRLWYSPIKSDENGSLTEADFLNYLERFSWKGLIERLVINPFDEALKKSGKGYTFSDFTVKVEEDEGSSTQWSNIYQKLKTFLEIRSDDSKAKGFKDLKYEEGIGYCISIDGVLEEIKQRTEEFTTHRSDLKVQWPQKPRNESYLHEIFIPDTDYSKIRPDTGLVALKARRFRGGLEKEVIEAFKEANKKWMTHETGYGQENVPPKEISPIPRVRHVGNLKYILINLVREEDHDYDVIIQAIESDLTQIKAGERDKLWEIYRPTADGFVNIKKLAERLETLYDEKMKPGVRFEIVP